MADLVKTRGHGKPASTPCLQLIREANRGRCGAESDRKTARQIILAGRCYELTTTTARRTKRRGWSVALKVLEPFGNLVLSR